MIVLDASAAILWIVNAAEAPVIAQRVDEAGGELHAPHLIDVEVTNALRRYVRLRELTATRAAEALRDFQDLLLVRHGHDVLLPRIWRLGATHSAYDAAYIALAEALRAPLLTADARLARSHGHDARVELVREP